MLALRKLEEFIANQKIDSDMKDSSVNESNDLKIENQDVLSRKQNSV